jgi:transforming growth factor-beta-induced protein
MINMSTVVTADVEATNGVVHVIDAVLVPSFIETRDIVELASATTSLSTLVAAVGRFPSIVEALSANDGTFTVFAPTNDAFAAALDVLGYASLDDVPDTELEQILQYHVIASAALQSGDLSDGQTAETLLAGESVTVSIQDGNVFINDSQVIMPDVAAVNGVVHVIDAVLVPSTIATNDIVEIASGADNLSILVQALTKFPDLVETLGDNSGSFTVFAPTDDAFAALLGVIGQTGLDDIPESVLRRVLEYHVVPNAELFAGDLTDGATAETVLAGESVTVSINGSDVSIDNANVTTADIEAVNGVIHIIDGVLTPSLETSIVNTVVEPAYFNVNFTTLTAAVVEAGLLETLIDPASELTVFAPTNAAFEAAGITSLEGLTANDLVPILQYHVLGSEVTEANLPATGSAVTTLNGDFYLSINGDGVFINGTSQVTATDIQADNGVVHVIDRTLTPPTSNVVEIAVAASEASGGAEFGQLVAALTAVEEDANAANLITALSDANGAFTVFAPTDAAFQTLYDAVGDQDNDGDNDITDLVTAAGGLETIATVLQYHVLSGRVFSTDIPNALGGNMSVTLSPLAGGSWTLNSDLTITPTDQALTVGLDDAAIVDTDILGTNGVIHVIDQVILP